MLNRIKNALQKCGISVWRIQEVQEESTELFFVKKQLDTRRIKDTKKYFVTVFREGEVNGKAMRGDTMVTVLNSMDDAEIETVLKDAYFAAQFAMNPTYELPDAVQAPLIKKTGALADEPMSDTAAIMTKAIFAADNRRDSFINSAELFVIKNSKHIICSTGTDVSWTDACVKGEYVVQCKEPEDVEMFFEYEYNERNPEALTGEIAEALSFVSDRAKAQAILKSGNYDLILSADSLPEVLSYYGARANAAMVFAHYSDWEAGRDVQENEDGESLQISLCATAPYNAEGLPMKDFALIRDGKVNGIYGETRFCRYLGIKPTGSYKKIRCENAGTVSFADMKKKPCLWAVAFSDFQMDDFSGHFGGEIRLAYLIDGDSVIPVTGGSVNGVLLDAQKHVIFSKERYTSASYEGPYAMRIPNVPIAGVADDQ